MAITLTVGTNTYISNADADTYLGNRLYVTAWTGASEDDQARALIMATKRIDRLVMEGIKKVPDQALQFPRCYIYDTRYPAYPSTGQVVPNYLGDGWYCETDVPQAVLDACCEEALALLASANDSRRAMQQAGVKSFTLGSLSETFTDAAASGTSEDLLSKEARALMKPYGARKKAVLIR